MGSGQEMTLASSASRLSPREEIIHCTFRIRRRRTSLLVILNVCHGETGKSMEAIHHADVPVFFSGRRFSLCNS